MRCRITLAPIMSDLDEWQRQLQAVIPCAKLEVTRLPGCSAIQLLLLSPDYPQEALDGEQMQRVMDNPLYWVFCWASGQVLAKMIINQPSLVERKRVVDFGCGSGVVAIAAALAGAGEVIACDIDPQALRVARFNAGLNGVELTFENDFDAIDGPVDLIFAADVLYDRGNFHWLRRFAERASRVVIADSRVKDFNEAPYRLIDRQDGCTEPDLDESAEFNDVRVYLAD